MPVPAISVDSLALTRLDLMKLDVEGMEMEVLERFASNDPCGPCRSWWSSILRPIRTP